MAAGEAGQQRSSSSSGGLTACTSRPRQVAAPALYSRAPAPPRTLPRPAPLQCFLSAGDKQLAVYFHLPKALAEAKGLTLKEWSAAVLAPVEGVQVGAVCGGASGRRGGGPVAAAAAVLRLMPSRCRGGLPACLPARHCPPPPPAPLGSLPSHTLIQSTPHRHSPTLLHPLPLPLQILEESEEYLKAVSPQDQEAGRFPLKQRDDAINAGFAWLREKGLLPADDSDDDVNYAEAAGVEW